MRRQFDFYRAMAVPKFRVMIHFFGFQIDSRDKHRRRNEIRKLVHPLNLCTRLDPPVQCRQNDLYLVTGQLDCHP